MSAPTIQQTLAALMSTDNGMRKQAEAYFKSELESNLVPSLQSLIQIFSDRSNDLVIRSFSGVLLRRAIETASTSLEPAVITQLREALLAVWSAEENPLLLKRLSHVMAQSASGTFPWSNLLPTVISSASGKPSTVLTSMLNLIEIISEYCPADIQTHLAGVGQFLGTFMTAEDTNVQVACARATAACIVALEDEGSRNAFRSALQPIINVLGNALSRGDEADATSIIEHLVTIAQVQPIFFKGAVDSVVAAMLTVARSDALEFSTRAIALELMVTLSETAPALARRCAGLLEGLVPLAMSLMLEFDESEAEWVGAKYTDEPVEGDYSVGEEAIERASAGMGGRVMAPAVVGLAQQFAARPEWTHRRAGVAAIARLADGSAQFFVKSLLPQAMQFLTSSIQDPSPIVQYEAIQTIGRFGTLFTDNNKELVAQFLPALVAILGNPTGCMRVRGHAASALINLMNPEYCEAADLKPHLDSLLGALIASLQGAALEVQSPCLVLLGCVAQVSEESFAPYYGSFMPGIKQILTTAMSPEQALLRGKAMECVGLLGEAVGASVFAPDALEIMTLLATAMRSDRDNDVTFDYILPACARISSALGPHFEPFLAVVMEPLLAGAAQVIEFSMEDVNDDEDDDGDAVRDEDTGMESAVISIGAGIKKRVTLNTHAVQQKAQAGRLMYEFGKSMKGHLKGFITPCLQALLHCMTDKHSHDLRSAASLALTKMFEAYLNGLKLGFPEVSGEALPAVLSACLGKGLECLKGEINPTARACAAEVMRDLLQACYESGEEFPDGSRGEAMCGPDMDIAVGITRELLVCCEDSVKRKQEKEAEFAGNEGLEAEDREAFTEELEEEEELLSNLVDAIGQLVKLHKGAFIPFFDQVIAPAFAPFLAPAQPAHLQVVATCMLDDVIEFGGEAAHKYIPQCLETFVCNMSSTHTVLRQCSVYGIAQSLRTAPAICAPLLGVIMPALVTFVSSPAAGEEENEGATENAVFAIGVVCSSGLYRQAHWGGVDASSAAGIWLRGLPLRADDKEAKLTHMNLCEAVERGDTEVLGAGYANLPHLLRIIAEVLIDAASAAAAAGAGALLAHASTADRMRAIARQVLQGGAVSQEALQASLAPLNEQQQLALRAVL